MLLLTSFAWASRRREKSRRKKSRQQKNHTAHLELPHPGLRSRLLTIARRRPPSPSTGPTPREPSAHRVLGVVVRWERKWHGHVQETGICWSDRLRRAALSRQKPGFSVPPAPVAARGLHSIPPVARRPIHRGGRDIPLLGRSPPALGRLGTAAFWRAPALIPSWLSFCKLVVAVRRSTPATQRDINRRVTPINEKGRHAWHIGDFRARVGQSD